MKITRLTILSILFSCILFSETTNKIYVALQGVNKVGILSDDTMEASTIDIDYDLDGEQGADAPHFIVIDEINRYWFVTAFSSEYVGRYNLDTDELIDKISVDDAPALMVLNEQAKKLYISRMMPMMDTENGMTMGSASTIIQEIDYSNPTQMVLGPGFSIGSPAPHGLGINQDGSEIYAVSNTADWFYKIIPETEEIVGVVMDENSPNVESPNIEVNRLKPIQCVSLNDNLLVITCSAGIAYDTHTGTNDIIPGQVQLWNTSTMTLIDTVQFSGRSNPWHVINSPINNEVFIALAGDQLYSGTSGVVCLSYGSNNISLKWDNYSDEFNNATLHGIAISDDGETLFVSSRGTGYLHILNANTGTLSQSIPFTSPPSVASPAGVAVLSSIVNMAISDISFVPQIVSLNNYPNPFNPRTTISFTTSIMQNITVEIIDLQGRVVESFYNRHLLPGIHSIDWNAEFYPSGQYLINISSGTYRKTAKATLIK